MNYKTIIKVLTLATFATSLSACKIIDKTKDKLKENIVPQSLLDSSPKYVPENSFQVKQPSAQHQAEIKQAIEYTNQLRREKGLAPLKYNPRLGAYAQRRAEELVHLFEHTRPNNASYKVYVTGGAGENIAAGSNSARKTVLEQWRNSSGHYANMIQNNYTHIGMGMVHIPGSKYGYYWVQIFGFEDSTTDYVFENSEEAKKLNIYSVAVNTQATGSNMTSLKIDGKEIPLKHTNSSWQDFQQDAYRGKVNGYDQTRFGVVQKDNEPYKVFHHGHQTVYDNMPNTGSANYTGKAIMTDGKTLNTNLDARFQADFGQKKLSGVLSEQGKKVLDIQANIRGTAFHSPSNAPVETQGAFFGSKAQEIGGVFYENATGKYGAFGAKQ